MVTRSLVSYDYNFVTVCFKSLLNGHQIIGELRLSLRCVVLS